MVEEPATPGNLKHSYSKSKPCPYPVTPPFNYLETCACSLGNKELGRGKSCWVWMLSQRCGHCKDTEGWLSPLFGPPSPHIHLFSRMRGGECSKLISSTLQAYVCTSREMVTFLQTCLGLAEGDLDLGKTCKLITITGARVRKNFNLAHRMLGSQTL